jgi:hypothetical protein
MSVRYSQSGGDGRPAEDDGRSFTTGIGSMVAPTADDTADDETAPPLRPTFTAKPSEPSDTTVPEPTPALDDTDEPERTVPTGPAAAPDYTAEPAPGPDHAAEPAQGPDDSAPTEPDLVPAPDVVPPPGIVPGPGLAPEAGLASADGGGMRPQPPRATPGLDEPLLVDAAGLHARWQRAQAGFVDDPREAVGDAADLIEQTAQAMIGALRQRQRELRVLWESGPSGDSAPASGEFTGQGADTEHLRQMMMHYRALFNQLCRP